MNNPFIRFTSNGGYLGRFCWCNTGAPACDGEWGSITLMPLTLIGGWAGSLGIIRYLTR